MKTVLFVDDEPYGITYFVDALEARGFAIVLIDNTDEAWDYLSVPRPEVCAVVLDLLMPPGKYLRDAEHCDGLYTGVLLYKRILESQLAISLGGRTIPVAVLTQVRDRHVFAMLERIQQRTRPSEPVMIWSKMDIEPKYFVLQFEEWLQALTERT